MQCRSDRTNFQELSIYPILSYLKTYVENGCQTTTRWKRFNHYIMHMLRDKLEWHNIYEDITYIIDNVAICLEIHL
jgi:hypothetical protein